MSVGEADRLHLYDVARERFDESAAQTLMNLLPPDHEQLATKADLAELRAATKADVAALATRDDMAELRTQVAVLDTKIDSSADRLRADLIDRMNRMLLAMLAMWVVLVALLAAARFG